MQRAANIPGNWYSRGYPEVADRTSQRGSLRGAVTRASLVVCVVTAILLGLYFSSLYSYLLFHSLAEIFSIIVASGIFMIAWNTRHMLANNYLRFLGISFLSVASIDLVHTLAYSGMGIFRGYDADLATQLWIAARYVESISFLVAVVISRRQLSPYPLLAAYTGLTALLLSFIFLGAFPDCYVEGQGLTQFKKISEYIISLILAASLVLLLRREDMLDRKVQTLIAWSVVLTIGAELAFTFYVSVYGLSNFVGHVLKIGSFYLIYRAIVETGMSRPYLLLFRDLIKSENSLRRSNQRHKELADKLGELVEIRTRNLTEANSLLEKQSQERKRTLAKLEKSEEKYRSIFETAASLIVTLDRSGTIIECNGHIEQLLGYSPEEAKGLSADDILHPDSQPEFQVCLEEVLRTGSSREKEYLLLKKDGKIVEVRINSSTLKDEKGVHSRVLCIVDDMTEYKKLEEQLRQAQKMEAVGHLTGGVAHDYNNMLTVIISYADLLMNSLKEDERHRSYVSEIRKAAERSANLTHQLLAFSRKSILQPEVLNINTLIDGTEKMIRRLVGEDIDLNINLQPDLGNVKVDPVQIEQIVMNLVVNARDAMPRGGKLMIETMNVELDEEYARQHLSVPTGSYVMLAISDSGVGMDKELQSHIFEPFFTTKGRNKGTGLGLSTVFGIVKQSGGNIWVYSEPGKGATFKIYLPLVQDKVNVGSTEAVIPANPGGQETVLLVEDDDTVRGVAQMVLQSMGYTVLEAKNAEHAINICKAESERSVHLLVTDVVMTGMNGHELARTLTSINSAMKVLYISGYTDNMIVHQGLLDEGISFLQKPFTPTTLTKKVRQVLDSAG
jgi:PAS domain S-box-containing protein